MTTLDIKKQHVITIKLGYAEGSEAPDCVNIDGDCSVLDLILAREAINQHIYDKGVNVSDFIAEMAEEYAKED